MVESYETLYAKHRFEEAEMIPEIAAPSKRVLNLVLMISSWDGTLMSSVRVTGPSRS